MKIALSAIIGVFLLVIAGFFIAIIFFVYKYARKIDIRKWLKIRPS